MSESYLPSYVDLAKSGKLFEVGKVLWDRMKKCDLCPRECRINRLEGKIGYCGATSELDLAGYFCHKGEEPPISGNSGSGTIFFAHCTLRCLFCQNYSFSHEKEYKQYTIDQLAEIMLSLQQMSVHNINFVTPEHYLPHILLALDKAVKMGLNIPLVYNTSSFAKVEILRMIDGVFDVYLPDIKFFDSMWAQRLCSAKDYPDIARAVLLVMKEQKMESVFSEDGLILNGLIIRHLVLPSNVSGTYEWMMWIRQYIGRDVYISLMSQYMPIYRAKEIPQVNRRITSQEYDRACRWMLELGLDKGWWQENCGLDDFCGEKIKNSFKYL